MTVRVQLYYTSAIISQWILPVLGALLSLCLLAIVLWPVLALHSGLPAPLTHLLKCNTKDVFLGAIATPDKPRVLLSFSGHSRDVPISGLRYVFVLGNALKRFFARLFFRRVR